MDIGMVFGIGQDIYFIFIYIDNDQDFHIVIVNN